MIKDKNKVYAVDLYKPKQSLYRHMISKKELQTLNNKFLVCIGLQPMPVFLKPTELGVYMFTEMFVKNERYNYVTIEASNN